MVELQNKYRVGVRKFGLINWVGAYNLYLKEVNRFFVVWAQTLLSPLISSLLFLSVLTLALGSDRGEVLGHPFINFLAPGLIVMSLIGQSFSHSVSSLMIGKMQGNIVDMRPSISYGGIFSYNYGGRNKKFSYCSYLDYGFFNDN